MMTVQISELEAKARLLGSRRLARDAIEDKNGGPKLLTHPWWEMPAEMNLMLDALIDASSPRVLT